MRSTQRADLLLGCLEALAAAAVAVLARMCLSSVLPADTAMFTLVHAAVAYAAWRRGLIPGIVAAASGALLTGLTTVMPSVDAPVFRAYLLTLPLFMVTAAAIVAIGQALRKADERLKRVTAEQAESMTALQESDRRLNLAFQSAPMGYWQWRLDSDRVFWSPEIERIHGIPEGSFEGTTEAYTRDIHPDDRAALFARVQQELESSDTHLVEYRIVRPDDSIRWVEGRGRIYRNSDGKAVKLEGICMDITERKEAELSLARRARELGALYQFTNRIQTVDSLHDVYEAALDAIVSALECDRASLLLYDDSMVMRFVGWRGLSDAYRRAVEGHSPWTPEDTDPVPFGIDDAENADLEETLKSVIRTEGISALGFVPLLVERKLLGKFMVYYDAPHRFSDEELGLAMTIAHQIAFAIEHKRTELNKAEVEIALRESEEKFRTMANVTPAIIWTAAPEGKITWMSDRWYEYTGFERATEQQTWLGTVHEEDLAYSRSAWERAWAEGREFEAELRIQRQDGAFRWFVVRATPRKDESGRTLEWYGSTTDIHDRKSAEENMREADRRKDEFLAMLAHELRNPLSPIQSGLEYARVARDDPQAVDRALDIMGRQVEHLTRLVDDLLDITRIKRGTLNLQMEIDDVGRILDQAIEMVRPSFESASQNLVVEKSGESMPVKCDPHRLRQVFANLLYNAFKFTPDGGSIKVRLAVCGKQAAVEFIDSGAGMDRGDLERIFEPFVQLGDHVTQRPIGIGVGLPLAKQLVDLHQGSISAASDGPGRGSSFTVRLPLSETLPQAPCPSNEVAKNGRHSGPLLVVDDNRDAADTLSALLRYEGYEVLTAYDGQKALQLYETARPTAVLLDLGMPGLDGYEVAGIIRNRLGGTAWLIALTGWGQQEDVGRTREAGFDAHLVKPASLATVKAELSRLADQQSQHGAAGIV